MTQPPLISFIMPAYNASTTIKKALDSVFVPLEDKKEVEVEVIVINDASSDKAQLMDVVDGYRHVKLIHLEKNSGCIYARNQGIQHSKGDYIVLLDSDDWLVDNWVDKFKLICDQWPKECHLCFSVCKDQYDNFTVSVPSFEGVVTLDDYLIEKYPGEYLPIIKGSFIRENYYIDNKTKLGCIILSYLDFIQKTSFYISSHVLRIYNISSEGSISKNWGSPLKALDAVKCYDRLIKEYGHLYRRRAPRELGKKLLKYSIYLKLSGQFVLSWKIFFSSFKYVLSKESFISFFLLLFGRTFIVFIVRCVKKMHLIKRFG